MKIAQAYAAGIVQALGKGVAVEAVVGRLIEVLTAHGRSSLVRHIVNELKRYARKSVERNQFTLTVPREEGAAHARHEAAKHFADSAPVVRVDSTIVGGWMLEGKGTRVDRSFKKQLISMYNQVLEEVK